MQLERNPYVIAPMLRRSMFEYAFLWIMDAAEGSGDKSDPLYDAPEQRRMAANALAYARTGRN